MIHLEQVGKKFGTSVAVADLSFELEAGKVTGFLGPNGAGKTTTMRMITGYLKPDSGKVRINGLDHDRHGLQLRGMLGYLPETSPLYADMTVVEYLETAGGLRGLRGGALRKALAHMTAVCGLGENLKKPIGALSKGYRQRVGLAQAMIHDPQILILDEPTTGLDPNQIRYIKDLVKQLGREKTLLLSTHILHHAPELCDRILVINKGRMVFDGTPEELTAQGGSPNRARLVTTADIHQLSPFLEQFPFVAGCRKTGETQDWRHFLLDGSFPADHMAEIFQALGEQGWLVGEWASEPPSLDGIFAALTGGAHEDHLTHR